MKTIEYYGVNSGRVLRVSDYTDVHLILEAGGQEVVLDAVQVDKLRQQFHEWLHERAKRSDMTMRWREIP